ncbi:MAG: prepilin-type N-terminal cleavage/methylation domain-containing protein [bacterium]
MEYDAIIQLKTKKAYTLIELVAVMTLIAIIAVVGFVALRSYRHQYLRAAGHRLVNDLKYARNLALTSGVWHGVSCEVSSQAYTVYATNGTVDTVLSKPSAPGQDFIVSLVDDYNGVSFDSVDFSGGNKVEFSPYGVPYTDVLGLAFTTTAEVCLSADTYGLTIKVEPETGRILIE